MNMKVTNGRTVTLSGFVMSGLLVFFAASCSFEERPDKAAVGQQAMNGPVKNQIEPPSFVANPFCFACHADFEEEQLAHSHMIAGIGCERCHGESERHRSDEANITPPELMYPRAKINPTCMMCHAREDIEHVNDHKLFLAGAETVFDKAMPEGPDKVCTDCHAKGHRMNVRSVRWDKATGKILEE